jgi:hypothetical protein
MTFSGEMRNFKYLRWHLHALGHCLAYRRCRDAAKSDPRSLIKGAKRRIRAAIRAGADAPNVSTYPGSVIAVTRVAIRALGDARCGTPLNPSEWGC